MAAAGATRGTTRGTGSPRGGGTQSVRGTQGMQRLQSRGWHGGGGGGDCGDRSASLTRADVPLAEDSRPSSRSAGPGRHRSGPGNATPGVQAPLGSPLCPERPHFLLHWGCRGFCGPLTTWTGSHAFPSGSPAGVPPPHVWGLVLRFLGSLVPPFTQAARSPTGPRGAPQPWAQSPDPRAGARLPSRAVWG